MLKVHSKKCLEIHRKLFNINKMRLAFIIIIFFASYLTAAAATATASNLDFIKILILIFAKLCSTLTDP